MSMGGWRPPPPPSKANEEAPKVDHQRAEIDRLKALLKEKEELCGVLFYALRDVLENENLEAPLRDGPSAIARAMEAMARFSPGGR